MTNSVYAILYIYILIVLKCLLKVFQCFTFFTPPNTLRVWPSCLFPVQQQRSSKLVTHIVRNCGTRMGKLENKYATLGTRTKLCFFVVSYDKRYLTNQRGTFTYSFECSKLFYVKMISPDQTNGHTESQSYPIKSQFIILCKFHLVRKNTLLRQWVQCKQME